MLRAVRRRSLSLISEGARVCQLPLRGSVCSPDIAFCDAHRIAVDPEGKNRELILESMIWRREWDSNPRYGFPHTRFPSVRLKPLGHLSGRPSLEGTRRILQGSVGPRLRDFLKLLGLLDNSVLGSCLSWRHGRGFGRDWGRAAWITAEARDSRVIPSLQACQRGPPAGGAETICQCVLTSITELGHARACGHPVRCGLSAQARASLEYWVTRLGGWRRRKIGCLTCVSGWPPSHRRGR